MGAFYGHLPLSLHLAGLEVDGRASLGIVGLLLAHVANGCPTSVAFEVQAVLRQITQLQIVVLCQFFGVHAKCWVVKQELGLSSPLVNFYEINLAGANLRQL